MGLINQKQLSRRKALFLSESALQREEDSDKGRYNHSFWSVNGIHLKVVDNTSFMAFL